MILLSLEKVCPIKNNSNYNYKDNSTTLRKNENGYVDENHVTTNSDGYKVCKTRIRSYRYPEIGDKFNLLVMVKKELLE